MRRGGYKALHYRLSVLNKIYAHNVYGQGTNKGMTKVQIRVCCFRRQKLERRLLHNG